MVRVKNNPPRTEFISIRELSDELQVPVPTLYQWRARNYGPRGARFGKQVRYSRADVDAWIATRYDDPSA